MVVRLLALAVWSMVHANEGCATQLANRTLVAPEVLESEEEVVELGGDNCIL